MHSLVAGFATCGDISYCYEDGHNHGDLVIAKGLAEATSVECNAKATSDVHAMCIVMIEMSSAAKPGEPSASAALPVEDSAALHKYRRIP